MKNNLKFVSVSDREVLINTCLSLLTLIRKSGNEDYRYFLRKAYINLNALVDSMIADGTGSVSI